MKKTLLAIAAVFALSIPSLNAASVLVVASGNADGNTQAIADFLAASGQFTSVAALNSNAFTFNTLNAYDRVLYFSNGDSGDPAARGDVLADFADTGKRLVLATFSWAQQGDNTIAGRLISGGYSPFVANGGTLYSESTIASTDGSDFFTGVNAITGYFRDNVSGASGATVRGTWADGAALLAQKGNVVGVNLFPDASFRAIPGDYQQLFINALSAEGTISAVPEPLTTSLMGAGLIAIVAFRRRK